MIAKVAVAVAAWMAFGGSALDYRLHVIIAPSYRFAATSTTYIVHKYTALHGITPVTNWASFYVFICTFFEMWRDSVAGDVEQSGNVNGGGLGGYVSCVMHLINIKMKWQLANSVYPTV